MATKSILKTVKIRESKLCRSFADAIEKTKYVKKMKYNIVANVQN